MPVAEAFGNSLGVYHLGAGGLGLGRFHPDRAQLFQFFAAALAQLAEPRQPALVALAPGAAAMGQPVQFLRDLAVALVALGIFLLQHRVAPVFEAGEALFQPPRLAAIQPHHGAGKDFPESAGHG